MKPESEIPSELSRHHPATTASATPDADSSPPGPARLACAGFRLSLSDAIIILACILTTWFLRGPLGEFALLFPFVLGHFFLFCNVFRVGTRAELVWCFCFIGVFLVSLQAGEFGIGTLLTAQSPVTLGVIGYALTRPGYHGIFWERIAGIREALRSDSHST